MQQFEDCTLVEIELHTGKTHQARQHALEIGQPIAGDKKYGDWQFNQQMQKLGLKRMFLHASCLTMLHPETKKPFMVEAPLPTELTAVVQRLGDLSGTHRLSPGKTT